MVLEWRDYLRLYGPALGYILAVSLVAIVGGIYMAGYRAGMRNLLDASSRAVQESCAG